MDAVITDIVDFFSQPNAYRSVLILIASIAITYFLSKFLADGIIKLAQFVSTRSDNETNDQRAIRLRQVETYLSIAVAVIRGVVVAVVAYFVWRVLSPSASSGAAAIGASAFFIVFAGQTLGMVLRDLTAGAIMIIEQWFNVGDFVKIEPFIDVSGVVERFTLRSTRLRRMTGEIVWIHNQQIQAVHVTPMGVRHIAVDVFVRDVEIGMATLKELVSTIPVGATMLAKPIKINKPEEWGPNLYRITIDAQTAPGREWLIEQFLVNTIKDVDSQAKSKAKRIFVYEPIARYSDPVADKRFKRAMRARKEQ